MTAAEAAGTDPQGRMLLEVTYEAFENGALKEASLFYSSSLTSVSLAGIPMKAVAGTPTSW